MTEQNLDMAMGWDDEITQESEFILLDKGEYPFKVEKLEKEYFNGSEKMAACPMAVLHLNVDNQVTVQTRLFLNKKTEWKLSQFFTSIGLKKKGEPLVMNWNAVYGTSGRLKLGHREYNGNTYHEVLDFLEPQAQADWTTGKF